MFYQIESPVFTESLLTYPDVEIFRTNVQKVAEAEEILRVLNQYFPDCFFNFDLTDCDKILRAKGKHVGYYTPGIVEIVTSSGYIIEVLPE